MTRGHPEGVQQCPGCYNPFPYYELNDYGECYRCEREKHEERLDRERDALREAMEDMEPW